MRKILITGGTVFVSRYIAEYFVKKDDVYVLNRNTHDQVHGVTLIEGNRLQLGDKLKNYDFDVILDITAYTKVDVELLINSVNNVKDYIFLSSSAVYPETLVQPFKEEQQAGDNKCWGNYGVQKYEAEQYLLEKIPNAYIIRPPYLYGPMNNLYREAFIFDCAMLGKPFYIPKDGTMPLQFFHIQDLCKFIDIILEQHPTDHIFNVGNEKSISINDWVKKCYQIVGKQAELINVYNNVNQRNYFSFYNYDYRLDVSKQNMWLKETKPLEEGLKESYIWYKNHMDEVNKKQYFEYIETNLK